MDTRQFEQHMLVLKEQVSHVPTSAGCYLWKDAQGSVLYVGKAKNLRVRMRQYVNGEDERIKIPRMMQEVESFDYIVVGSEHEALVLEINLIQQYKPPYNVDLRDDKSYPYIALTMEDMYPAIKYTREKHKKKTHYFGPYTNAKAAKQAIDTLRKVVPICSATCTEWKKVKRLADKGNNADILQMTCAQNGRPCFDYHVGKGPGVCAGAISPEQYHEHVADVEQFLLGHRKNIIHTLHQQMEQAAQELDFEKASRIKRRVEVLKSLDDKQEVVFSHAVDADVFGFWREETIAGVCVLIVREGRVVRSCDFILNKGLDISEEELVSGYLKRYYRDTADIPSQIDIACKLDDASVLESWLEGKAGHKITIHVPQRGKHAHLVQMANTNARHALMRYSLRTGYEDQRTNTALLELESALALEHAPMRIECFDISTLHGKHTVASMVVFQAGKADTSQYRRFKIKAELDEANDFLSMQEVLGRRYAKERMQDERFGKRPDLLILDGGKPQLSAAMQQLEALGLDIPCVGLAKSDEELFVPWDDKPVVLPTGSASLYLVKQIRDEAHRFAITYHRKLRKQAMTVSILDEIEGVGPKRKKALLKAFGSMKKLREATQEQIAHVSGISPSLAKEIYETLQMWNKEFSS